ETYVQIANIGKTQITLNTLIVGGLSIVLLLVPVKKADELAKIFHSQVKIAKRQSSEEQLRLYQAKEADKKAWLFSLYSIVVFLALLIIQVLVINLLYPFFSNYLLDNIFATIFISIFALAVFLLVHNHHKQDRAFSTFRYYGKWFVTLNFAIIAMTAFFFYEYYVQRFSTLMPISLSLDYSSGLIVLFIITIYFHSINISAFLAYGYDSGIAWLFPKSSTPTHWAQKLFFWIDKHNPKIRIILMQRMPESILHWHSTCGGTIGAFLGHKFFIHKMRGRESKVKFAPIFKRTVILQILLIIAISILEHTI
ncbi:MAG: DUF1294 domain-containing protein, partial [Cyanobacteria bacterium J06558_2]